MPHNAEDKVFTTLEHFYVSSEKREKATVKKVIHCVNPFPAKVGTEHYKAQEITFASMTRARDVAKLICPQVEVLFADATLEEHVPTPSIEFDLHYKLTRSATDVGDFKIPRPLPLVMDVLMAVPIEKQDIFVFTNVDIALVSGFYAFISSLFERGVDCAIINRRTISQVYSAQRDHALMEIEVGTPHPGFDCFALRGSLLEKLIHYDGCIGIGGVMLPLVHQLLAIADHPLVLLDAHATYHLGDDKDWDHDDFIDYLEHNAREIDRVFAQLIEDGENKKRLLSRLAERHQDWVFPERLRRAAGVESGSLLTRNGSFPAWLRTKLQSLSGR